MKLAAALAVVLASLPVAAAPQVSPEAALQQGKRAIQRHEYKEAEDTLKPLLDQLSTEDGLVEAHRLLASSYYFQNKKDEARQEAIEVLTLRPDFKLDPNVDNTLVVALFDDVRREQAARLAEIKRRKAEEQERVRLDEERKRAEERARFERVYIERTVVKHSRWIAMLPFGIGQAQNGEPKLAAMFASTELALGAASLSLWITVQAKFPGGQVPASQESFASLLGGLQIGFGAAFWGMAIIGIIEAQARFVPEVVREKELHSKPKRLGLNLAPILSPGQFGLGVQGAF